MSDENVGERTSEDRRDTGFNTNQTCPECDEPLEQQGRETVCTECGLVVAEDLVDRGPEWQAHDAREASERSRVGGGRTKRRVDKGLGSDIGETLTTQTDANNKRTASQSKRLQRQQQRSIISGGKEGNRDEGLQEIERLAIHLDGFEKPDADRAAELFWHASEENHILGSSVDIVVTAVVLLAVREQQRPIQLDELIRRSRVDETTAVTRKARKIGQELNIKQKIPEPREFVDRVIAKLEGEEYSRLLPLASRARELIDPLEKANLHSGKKPVGIAAAAVYAAGVESEMDNNPSQRDTAAAAQISTDTLSKRYQDIRQAAQEAGEWSGTP